MLYSRDHVWIDETDPARAKVGVTRYFRGDASPAAIPAPVDMAIVSFRDHIPLHDLNSDPEGAGYIAVVSCTDSSQLVNLMTRAVYEAYCRRNGADDTWNITNNPVRFPPDPYTEGQTFAEIEGS
jgi:glycine cleavage system H lipoate-binding protein